MVTVSLVLYNNVISEVKKLIDMVLSSECVLWLYIIDNSQEDNIGEFSSIEKVSYTHNPKNIGFGAAHNIAIRKAIGLEAKYHIVINPDIEFGNKTFINIVKFMDENSNIGLVMPKILYPDGTVQYLCKMLPTPFDWIFRRFLPCRGMIKRRNDRFELRQSGYNNIMNIPYLSGCFMAFRISVLKEIGLFDEHIFMYGEDTDITRRIHKKYGTVFFPLATAIHMHNKESYRNYRLLWIHIKSAIYYFNKWGWFFDRERKEINKNTLRNLGLKS